MTARTRRSASRPRPKTCPRAKNNEHHDYDAHGPYTYAVQQPIITRLHDEAVKVVQEPAIRDRFLAEGAEPIGSSPDQFSKFVANEIAKWTKVVKEAGIKAEL